MLLRDDDDGPVFSWDVLEAAPALIEIVICSKTNEQSLLGGAALQSIAAALRHSALGNLQELVTSSCIVGDADVKDVMDVLEGSGCAEQVTSLQFHECDVGAEGVRALATLLSKGAFPALEKMTKWKRLHHRRGCCGSGRRFAANNAYLYNRYRLK